jgi:DNA-binding response OmpR family regulator
VGIPPAENSTRPAAVTVVVADDDEVTSTLVERQLEKLGYRVVTAANGQAALRAVLAEKPSLLLLDISMPGMTGFDVLERLKSLTSFPRPKVLVMSSGRDAEDVKRALDLGADDFLGKPFKPEDLLARVHRFV